MTTLKQIQLKYIKFDLQSLKPQKMKVQKPPSLPPGL